MFLQMEMMATQEPLNHRYYRSIVPRIMLDN